jgi:hypothetical protein
VSRTDVLEVSYSLGRKYHNDLAPEDKHNKHTILYPEQRDHFGVDNVVTEREWKQSFRTGFYSLKCTCRRMREKGNPMRIQPL